jgi:hypothetical protein
MTISLTPTYAQMKYIGLNNDAYYLNKFNDEKWTTSDYDQLTDVYFATSKSSRSKIDSILTNAKVDPDTQKYVFVGDDNQLILTKDEDIKGIPLPSGASTEMMHTNQKIGLRVTSVNYDAGYLGVH